MESKVQKKSILRLVSFAMIIVAMPATQKCAKEDRTSVPETPGLSLLLSNKDLQLLGENIFFDKSLSVPEGQSCSSCHDPAAGWTSPDEEINKAGAVFHGALHQRFSNRKPNSAAYATFSPVFHGEVEDGEMLFVGGNFWDGRASGYILGNPAADQAQGPFLNPVEQNLPDEKALIEKILNSGYAHLFQKAGREIWGIKNIAEEKDESLQFAIISLAIAAFENSVKVNQFSSKYDYYLQGKTKLTEKELQGLRLFNGKGKCVLCHPSSPEPDGSLPLFTDFTYDNLGLPANPQNPWYTMDSSFNPDGPNWIDPGLKGFLQTLPQYAMYAGENYGKHRVPTLRNVDKRPYKGFVKAYGHNGYFKSLEEIVHFYNTRDVLPPASSVADPKPGINCWPETEVAENVNTDELGDLGLTPEEESAIVEFMKTLTDGWTQETDMAGE